MNTDYVKLGKSYIIHSVQRNLSIRFNVLLAKPFSLHLVMTQRCNSRCPMCPVWRENDYKNELTTVELENLITQANRMGIVMVVFGGGEPLLRDDTFELIQYVRELGMIPSMITNGTLINEEKADFLVKHLFRIGVSLDGSDSKTYETVRGINAFDKVVKNINLLVKAKKRNKSPVNIYVQTTITKGNIKDILKIVKIAKKLEVGFLCQPFLPILENEKNSVSTNLTPDSEGLTKLVKELKKYNNVLNPEKHLDFIIKVFNEPTIIKCPSAYEFMSIGPKGDVFTCHKFLSCKEASLGNVRINDLETIWKSKKFEDEGKKEQQCTEVCGLNCVLPGGYGSWFIKNLLKMIKNDSNIFD